MSHSGPQPSARSAAAADDAAEQAVVQAIINHHAQLADGLNQRAETLLDLVANDHLLKAETARQDLVAYLRREILPHAQAEEQVLYPPAAALPEGRLLVAGMVDEHHALADLVAQLAAAKAPVRAAALSRAVTALFATHLHKENDLVLPLLLAAPDVRLSTVLAGMHDLLGADSHHDTAHHDTAHHDAAHHDSDPAGDAVVGGAANDCGCGGCGCGGDRDSGETAVAAAPVLSVDTRLDVRDVPHSQRHALVLSTVDALAPGHAVVLVAGHAPRPVLAELDDRFGAQIQTQWLQAGPEVWQVRLERVAAPA
jgi:uncharacterized protein (DUF2249 family)/iron-sulfur cluster repair protein YtfE (RIC family)